MLGKHLAAELHPRPTLFLLYNSVRVSGKPSFSNSHIMAFHNYKMKCHYVYILLENVLVPSFELIPDTDGAALGLIETFLCIVFSKRKYETFHLMLKVIINLAKSQFDS
jgi:hypothetical protein